MSLGTLEKVVASALEEAEVHCEFAFQGGEPLLAGLDFFRAFVAFVKKYNRRGIKTQFAIQTNGILLNLEWAEFFAENKFLLGLSIDGEKAIHDGFRKDFQGKGTHSRCLAAARLLETHKVEFNILSVVTKQLAAHPDQTWNFYKKHGFHYIQFIPCIESLDGPRGNQFYSLTPKIYGQFLCRMFDLWYESFQKGTYVSIRGFDNYIQILMGNPPENCAMTGVCKAYALVEADGSVYPCDFYVLERYLLGNIHTESFETMLRGEIAQAFAGPSAEINAECLACAFFKLCRGGCRRDREVFPPEALSRNIYCESYQMLLAHALPRMQQVARSLSGRYSRL